LSVVFVRGDGSVRLNRVRLIINLEEVGQTNRLDDGSYMYLTYESNLVSSACTSIVYTARGHFMEGLLF